MSKPIIIDFEASGLDENSYPIEVGVAFEDGSTYVSLIRPEDSWVYWNPESEKVHNIPRDKLFHEGTDAKSVAEELNRLLDGKTVLSDAKDHDEFWADVMFNAAGISKKFTIQPLQWHIQHPVQKHYYFKEKKKLFGSIVRHRAGNDAIVMQNAYLYSVQMLKEWNEKLDNPAPPSNPYEN